MSRDGSGCYVFSGCLEVEVPRSHKRTAGHDLRFDSCTKYFVSVTKYLIEYLQEEVVVILAPGCKGPAWDHVASCVGTEHHGGRSVCQRLEANLHF